MKRAFTLIEVLVATMLLAMLVTILTMIFNQSSIAWTTGVASVTALGEMREDMSVYAAEAENALLSDDGQTVLRVTSIWNENGEGLRQGDKRTLKLEFGKDSGGNEAKPAKEALIDKDYTFDAGKRNRIALNGENAAGQDSYLVGVHSYGPDGKTGGDYSWDDISTLPEEVVK